MKHLVVLIALFAVVSAAIEWIPKNAEGIREVHRECAKETELTTEQLEKVENFEFPDEEKVRKYVLCGVKKLRVFCQYSGYHRYRLIMQFDVRMEDEEVMSVLQECLDDNEQKSPIDVWAFRGQECILKSKVGDMLKDIFKQQKEKLAKQDASASESKNL